ncbi:MAG: hypothetical protein K2M73_09535 [Lachnospiraceae bacterium]|nr:hypothetical protein [Lachnospiraceae bacterium]
MEEENEIVSVIPDDVKKRLEYTQNIRKLIIDGMTNHGNDAPSGSKDIEALNAVLDSMDRNEFERIKLDVKNSANKAENNLKASIAELYKTIASKQVTINVNNRNIDLPDKFIPDDIKPGEDFVGHDPLDKKDFV